MGQAIAIGTVGIAGGPAAALLGYLLADNVRLPSLDFLNGLTAFSYRLEGPLSEPVVSAFRTTPFGF